MLRDFGHFNPLVVGILKYVLSPFFASVEADRSTQSLGESVKCWPLSQIDPLPTWTRGKLVLIGDAAHPVRNRQGEEVAQG